jgi:hypothetical protein
MNYHPVTPRGSHLALYLTGWALIIAPVATLAYIIVEVLA